MNLLNFSYIAEIAVSVIAFVSAIIAWLSLRDSKKRQKRAKALDLACWFKDRILKDYAYLDECFKDSDFYNVCKGCFNYEEMCYFDVDEMDSLIKKNSSIYKSHHDFHDLIYKIDINNIVSASINYSGYKKFYENMLPTFSSNNEDARKKLIEQHYRNELNNKLSDLLNTLEWFSMNFISGVADEETVYSSLHQNFLSLVHSLYYFISYVNKEEYEKYYTNIIELFHLWSSKQKKAKEKELSLERKSKSKKNKKINKKQRKI